MNIISEVTHTGATHCELKSGDVEYRVGFMVSDNGIVTIVQGVFVDERLARIGAASWSGERVYTKKQ